MKTRKTLYPPGGASCWLAAITLIASLTLSIPDAQALKVLFVGGQPDAAQGADPEVMDMLIEWFGEDNVTYVDSGSSTTEDAEDVDVVVLSSTPGSGSIRTKFRDVPAGVVNWEEALANENNDGNFPFTNGAKPKINPNVDPLQVVDNSHPITQGLDLGDFEFLLEGGAETWGSAPELAEGVVVLIQDANENAALAVADTGAVLWPTLDDDPYLSPGPRIMFPMTDSTASQLTDEGWELLKRCIQWAGGDLGGSDPTLVGWYSFDEGAGETAGDSSGKGYDGEIIGDAPEWVAEGKFGGALFLPGTDEFVEIADNDDHEFAEGEAFSVALWVKSDIDDNDNGLVTKGYHDDSRDANYWMLQTLGEGFGFDSRCCDGGGEPRIKPQAGGDSDDDEWHHLAIVRDTDTETFFLYLDGEETGVVDMDAEGGNWDMGVNDDPTVIGNHFNRFTPTFVDDLGIWRRALSADEVVQIMENGIASIAGGSPAADGDGDGLPDDYEAAEENGCLDPAVADGDQDPDNDTLTSAKEFELRTNPCSADSDGDGLNDNIETNTGVWVSATDTGTNPLRDDSDKDGLKDGVETNTGTFVDATNSGTDPLNDDTDGDGANDGLEVSGGTNPLDPNSVVSNQIGGGFFLVEHLWTDGFDQIGDALTAEDFLNEPTEDYMTTTVDSKWIHFHDNTAPPWFRDESEPYPLWKEDGFGARDDFAIRARGQINIVTAGTATFVCNSDDGFDLRIDGESIGEAGNRGRANSVMEVELTAGLHDLEFIHWERGGGAGVTVTIYRGTDAAPAPDGSNFELLEAFGGGTAPFEITNVTYTDGEPSKVNLTWNSSLGESYTVSQSADLQTWLEITDGHPSAGDSTSFEVELAAPTTVELYFRIAKEE